MSQDFLGRGWSFPPTFSLPQFTVAMTEQEADIEASLRILLSTAEGERVMEPKYGCNMDELVFEALSTTLKTQIIDKIKTAILYFEPRIDVNSIELNSDSELEGIVLVAIEYTIRSTNSRFNFVYPYYILEGTELNLITTNATTA